MILKGFPRTFFILFNDGDTFYFTLNENNEIQCPRLKNIYENTKQRIMPIASILEFNGNGFELKNKQGEKIFSLAEYRKAISKDLPIQEQTPTIEKVYIDEDVRDYLLSEEKIKYDEECVHIPGLLYEMPSEQTTTSYTKKKTKRI